MRRLAFCGSSPRMRGALPRTNYIVCWEGIIPADAGSTDSLSLLGVGVGDHPRGCGEHMQASSIVACNSGSSPRMRGALWGGCANWPWTGIIPADAGSTFAVYMGKD